MRKSLKKVAATALAGVLALTVVAGVGSTASAAKKKKAPTFDPAGSYYASLGFQQTGSWRFHNEVTDETLGLNGTDYAEAGLNYETDAARSHDTLEKIDGEVQGAELTGNGTYTVKITGLNGVLAETPDGVSEEMKMSMIYLSTNIPADAKDKVQFTDVSLKVDGNPITLPDTQFFKPETLDAGYLSLYLVDTYAKSQGEYVDSPELAMPPNDSIEIQFTISGFANDNPEAVAETPTPEPETDTADTTSSDSDSADDEGGSSVNGGLIAGIVIAVVVVAGVVVVVTRKKD